MLYVNPLLTVHEGTFDGKVASDPVRERVALEELEHYFLFTLLKEMRKTVPDDGLFGGGPERQLYDEMLDDALSAAMAKSGQLGVADTIEAQLRAAEVQRQVAESENSSPGEMNPATTGQVS